MPGRCSSTARRTRRATPAMRRRSGIAFIHQELNLFTNLTIAENIFIDGFPRRRFGPVALIDRAAIAATHARAPRARSTSTSPPETPVERLSPGERQLVEVAKALQLDARIIIFDEPTTSLTARETERLFAPDRPAPRGRHVDDLHLAHPLRTSCGSPTTSPSFATARWWRPGRCATSTYPGDHDDGRPSDRPALPAAAIPAAGSRPPRGPAAFGHRHHPGCRASSSMPARSSASSG